MKSMPPDLRVGGRVTWPAGKLSGFIDRIEGRRAHVVVDDGSEKLFSLDAGVIVPEPFASASHVMRPDGTVGVVLSAVDGQSYPTWRVAWADGSVSNAVEMTLRPAVIGDPIERFKAQQLSRAREFNLRSTAADLWTKHLHDDLISLSHARVDLKPHQVSVVHRVASGYPHRYLLCDEVGLGKTIEAAMIVKELRARGLARRVLVLVPSGLVRQWQFELKTKFNETFAIFDTNTMQYLRNRGVANPWTDTDSVITSHAWASWTAERRAEIAAVDWDLVIVDEAHHARRQRQGNRIRETNVYRLVSEITARPEFARRAALFLTATPMQLQRHELFSLVEMLHPVLFASEADFGSHLDHLAGLNQLVERIARDGVSTGPDLAAIVDLVSGYLEIGPADARSKLGDPRRLIDELRDRHRLSEVLIRNRRAVIGGFMPRRAYRWEVELSEYEAAVQEKMDGIIAEGYELAEQTRKNAVGFLMVIWQKLAASSSRALLQSLRGRRERLMETASAAPLSTAAAEELLAEDAQVTDVARRLGPTVADEVRRLDDVVELLERITVDSKAQKLTTQLQLLFAGEPDAKVLVFTEFRETQQMLSELIGASGWGCHIFHGQLGPLEKDAAVEAFRNESGPQVLVSTEAGGEGRNFQFAHILVNYDLPWNPMRMEQRIGRVDRIGQEHPVTIFNFHVQGTIESRILDVLERRIRLFEDSVGGLDPILGDAESDIRRALRLTAEARDNALAQLGDKLGERVDSARRAEAQLRDFILDTRSFSAEIAQVAQQQKASIGQLEFDRLLLQLLKSVNTWVGEPDERGERRVQFHPPFTEEHSALVGSSEKRRVCFDPRLSVDSEHVEYFGFGHPIVDTIMRRVIEERADGVAAVRLVSRVVLPAVRPGWQFNWMMKIGGLDARELVYSVFVDDERFVDQDLGAQLLALSGQFRAEETDAVVEPDGLDAAHSAAQTMVGRLRDSLMKDSRERALDRYEVERGRVQRLFDHRAEAAHDRVNACTATLDRLRTQGDTVQRQAIPLWEANLARAERELGVTREDRTRRLLELAETRNPQAEFSLLCVARIEVRELHQTAAGS